MPTSIQYIFLAGATLAITAVTVFLIKQKKKQWQKVGKVTDLYLHPVKSMRGIQVNKLVCTKKGFFSSNPFFYDRSFLVIRLDGNMITGRTEPKLVTIDVLLKENSIVLCAPKMSSVEVPIPKDYRAIPCKVWGEKTFGLDCGDDVAKWISNFLQSECRLVYHSPEINGRKIVARDKNQNNKFSSSGNIMYHDSTPGHLISTASLQDLEEKLNAKISLRRFRPNIIVDECQPYEEDCWMQIKIGSTEFAYVRDTYRCVLTTVDPEDGTKSAENEPLKTLRQYRTVKKEYQADFKNSPPFGVSLAVIKEGEIHIDDIVYAC